jgi:inner membrane protein
MYENQQPTPEPSFWEKNKMLFKGLMIGALVLVLMIPAALISELVSEREQRQAEVIQEISKKWASAQTMSGPIIEVPYVIQTNGQSTGVKAYAYLLPEHLNINGKLLPEIRHRSLYDVTLYRSDLKFTGSFDPSYLQKLDIPAETVLWTEARLLFGLDDARGLEDEVSVVWNNAKYLLEAGVPDNNNLIKSGMSTKLAVDPIQKSTFEIALKLKGSSSLYFTPVGKTTSVALNSPWKDPAFDGQYLPSEPANISEKGFSAKWKVLQLSRSYPQAWKNQASFDLKASSFGVKLLQPTDSYAKTDRSVKYAIMIIALTFAIFFFVEIFQKRQVHPLQYILVGLALCVFYTLLLSISEYIGFNGAYLIAAIATVTLISLYTLGIFKQVKIAAGFAMAIGGLYTYIFVLIQLQDYSLLFGSIGLFIILSIIMYFSRKIDWYGTGQFSATLRGQ